MRILAIETSCDDTGIAILETSNKRQATRLKVLANIVSSQQIHQNYGGVFPMMAYREHQKNLVPVTINALKEAKLLIERENIAILDNNDNLKKIFKKEQELYKLAKKFLETYEKPEVDAIAVTYGPGLEPCLWTGVNFARSLSYIWKLPIVPVNHIEAHILVNFLDKQLSPFSDGRQKKGIMFPAMSLVVSGGHTQLILIKGIGKYKIIGETRDDAAGECFDKCAKILGLGYPGGPIISKMAAKVKKDTYFQNRRPSKLQVHMPRPMMHTKDYDFSFSGLKTAVLYKTRDRKENPSSPGSSGSAHFVAEMCFEVQQSIIDVLLKKTLKAAKDFKAKTIILGGGVSANSELRSQFKLKVESEKLKVNVVFPEPKLSTDNALMIAVTGYFNKAKKIAWNRLSVHANLRIGKTK